MLHPPKARKMHGHSSHTCEKRRDIPECSGMSRPVLQLGGKECRKTPFLRFNGRESPSSELFFVAALAQGGVAAGGVHGFNAHFTQLELRFVGAGAGIAHEGHGAVGGDFLLGAGVEFFQRQGEILTGMAFFNGLAGLGGYPRRDSCFCRGYSTDRRIRRGK